MIPLLAGLATGFAFIPPSAGSVLVANMLNVDLGVMIAVGVPVGILSLIFAGILWSKLIGNRMNTGLPSNIQEVREAEDGNLPPFYSAVYYSCSAGFNLIVQFQNIFRELILSARH